MKKRIVFDIDDVISTHINRDYENAIPHYDVIRKMNRLYNEGFIIILNTSRGMVSCNGDVNLIKEKNEDILVNWLQKHNVKYHELAFGKPLGDMYIDDKCMNVREFMEQGFYELKGGSKKSVYRMGNLVKKELAPEKVQRIKEWSETAIKNNLCNTPIITSSLYNCIYMEFVEGMVAADGDDFGIKLVLTTAIEIIENFKLLRLESFDINKHLEILHQNKGYNLQLDEKVELAKRLLLENATMLEKNATFCHGDLTLSNIILQHNYEVSLIDCEMDKEASSYLLDYAKLYMSLLGYEQKFGLTKSKINLGRYKTFLEDILKDDGIYDIVIILTYMYILRLTRYKGVLEFPKILDMLCQLEGENEQIFKGK